MLMNNTDYFSILESAKTHITSVQNLANRITHS